MRLSRFERSDRATVERFKTMTPMMAAQLLRIYVRANQPAFLEGQPGIAKSDLVRQEAASLCPADLGGTSTVPGVALLDVRAGLLDAVDVKGLPVPDLATRRTEWLSAGFLPYVERDGEFGILFLDELPQAPSLVQAGFLQLILDRRIGSDYVFPPGWRIVAAGNRQGDRAGAGRLLTPLANRFAWIPVEPDAESWRLWATATGLHPAVIAFASGFRPALLTNFDPNAVDRKAFASPRTWHAVSDLLQRNPQLESLPIASAADQDGAQKAGALRLLAVAGHVGFEVACEFEGFFRSWKSLSALMPAVLSDPKTAPVPSDPSTLWALVCAMASKASAATFGTFLTYAERLPREFEVLLGVTATRRDAALTTAPGFAGWSLRNQGVVL